MLFIKLLYTIDVMQTDRVSFLEICTYYVRKEIAMEISKHLFPILELIAPPAFCVKDKIVIATNAAAERIMLHIGMNIQEIVTQNRDDYEKFTSGSLFFTITAGGVPYNACVTRTNEFDIFTLNQAEEDSQLQALALAAQQLRIPLANMMTVSDKLLAELDAKDSNTQHQVAQINKSLFQMLRIIGNMSDADSYKKTTAEASETINFTAFFNEIMEKIQTVSESSKKKLLYTGPNFPILGLADAEKLGRAIYNMMSNALKFSPEGSTIEAKLAKSKQTLSFTVINVNSETAENCPFWNRYSRIPAIEDEHFGLGLGMSLIGSVACAHGGTVLTDHPSQNETRITFTITLTKGDTTAVRSPIFRIGDYAGGRDKGLLELSEVLPAESKKKIN